MGTLDECMRGAQSLRVTSALKHEWTGWRTTCSTGMTCSMPKIMTHDGLKDASYLILLTSLRPAHGTSYRHARDLTVIELVDRSSSRRRTRAGSIRAKDQRRLRFGTVCATRRQRRQHRQRASDKSCPYAQYLRRPRSSTSIPSSEHHSQTSDPGMVPRRDPAALAPTAARSFTPISSPRLA